MSSQSQILEAEAVMTWATQVYMPETMNGMNGMRLGAGADSSIDVHCKANSYYSFKKVNNLLL